jgi:hypothetical protein
MKKVSLFFIAVLFISSGSLFAQGFHIGVKGGVNMTKIDGRSFDEAFKWGLSAGGFAELNFTNHIGIQPEVLFSQIKTKTAEHFSDIYQVGGYDNQNLTLNYLSIPILLAIKPSPLLSILVGPQFGIKLNEDNSIVRNGQDAFKTGDFSVVGGAQLNLGGFKLGARYAIGLNNTAAIKDIEKVDTWKSQSIQLYLGFRII